MAAGTSLDVFVDFWNATRQYAITDPDTLVSMASSYRTYLWPRMMKGLTEDLIIQSGSEITDFVQLNFTNSFEHFNAPDTFDYTGTDSLVQVRAPWRFSKVHSVINEFEIDLQQGDRETVFKRVKRAKMSELELSWFEGMEAALFATPSNETMESSTLTGTGAPMSLRCYITDDGLAPSSTNGGVASADFSTVLGISPTTYTNWRNQYVTFDNTSVTSREATFIPAMDDMWISCQYQSPTNSEEYVKSTSLQKMRIITNKATILMLVKLATQQNNVLTPKSDIGWANGTVVYHGLPIDYIGILDSIETGADTGTTNKYRCRYLNLKHFRPIHHKQHFRRQRTLDGGAGNPNASVVLEDTWHQLWCSNRREQGIVRAA